MPDIDKAVARISTSTNITARRSTSSRVGKARDAFAIDREDGKMRDAYGMNTFGQSLLLAPATGGSRDDASSR